MHLISTSQFKTRESLDLFLSLCDSIDRKSFKKTCKGKILATLFYEPSTRTRLSFETAMYKLGGNVITQSDPANTSITKGESLEDTIVTVNQYADVIALRHPTTGAAARAAEVSKVPVINAGDGPGEHPTQALLDVYTIKSKRTLDNLTVLICGDLFNGRTVHSIVRLLALYEDLHLVLCSPKELGLPDEIEKELVGVKVSQVESVSEGIKYGPDVIYMTRQQKERVVAGGRSWVPDYSSQQLTSLQGVRDECIIMHPMPRNEEFPVELDKDIRCVHLTQQPKNGVRVRMGLIYSILSGNVPYTKRK